MHHQVAVLNRFPEAQAVMEAMARCSGPWAQRGRWFIYAAPEPDARVLGYGDTEELAWASAARRLGSISRKIKWSVAG
jgi:hypothetical protein